jgi:N-acetylneuraminic acid mutarotase
MMQEGIPNLVLEWAPIAPEGDKPVPRGGHSAVAADSTLVVFGGHSYGGEGKFYYYNDTHLFDAETGIWHSVHCGGELPQARYGHSVALVGNRMFMFGGKGETSTFRDVHFLDLIQWTWVPVSSTSAGPSPRLNHASCLVGRKIVVHGGWDGAKRCLNDLWVFDTDAFTWLNPRTAGLPPTPRYGHELLLMNDGRILLFGGMTNEGQVKGIPEYFGDLRQLETETMVWSKPRVDSQCEFYPSARYNHSLTPLGGQLLLFGGWGLGGLQAKAENNRPGAESVFAFDVETHTWWQPPMPSKMFEHKYGHTTTVMGNTMFIFGGWSGKQASNTLVQVALSPAE